MMKLWVYESDWWTVVVRANSLDEAKEYVSRHHYYRRGDESGEDNLRYEEWSELNIAEDGVLLASWGYDTDLWVKGVI
jgi:hypothetical protein